MKVVFPSVPEQHPDFAAMLLIRRILDDGLSSRLPFNVVEKRGLAYSIHAGMEAFDDTGLFDVEAASNPKKAAKVIEQVLQTLAELRTTLVPEEELERAKTRHRMLLDFAQDSTGELAGWFGGTEIFRRPETFEQRARKVERVSRASLRQVARRMFDAKKVGVIAVGPREGVKAIEAVAKNARKHLG
jgi:predicted Zn-dependent peptidase